MEAEEGAFMVGEGPYCESDSEDVIGHSCGPVVDVNMGGETAEPCTAAPSYLVVEGGFCPGEFVFQGWGKGNELYPDAGLAVGVEAFVCVFCGGA